MNYKYLILIGLIFNLVGALFLAFEVVVKRGKGFIEFGQSADRLKTGVILLVIGFLLQAIGVFLN